MSTSDQNFLHELMNFEASYWYEVDLNYGRKAHDFYLSDGVFAVGKSVMPGPEAVAKFYQWREQRGARTSRHLVTNFLLLSHSRDAAKFYCVMCLYADDGEPVLPSAPPIMIADIEAECVRGADGAWRFKSHRLTPIFEGGVPATIPPQQ